MCGCSANFDGHEDIEELEERKFLDFDGDDGEMEDEEFSNFRISFRSKEKRDYIDDVKSSGGSGKDARTSWRTTKKGGGTTSSTGTVFDPIPDPVPEPYTGGMPTGSPTGSGVQDIPKQIMGEASSIGGKNTVMIVGGILAIGLIGFLAVKAIKK